MASFGIAHILYISAFGLKPLKLKLGLFLFSLAALSIYIYSNLISDAILKYGVSIYSILIFTMGWRSVAAYTRNKNEIFCVIGKKFLFFILRVSVFLILFFRCNIFYNIR